MDWGPIYAVKEVDVVIADSFFKPFISSSVTFTIIFGNCSREKSKFSATMVAIQQCHHTLCM